MNISSYNYPNGYINIYQNHYNKAIRNSYMYQNPYNNQYGYSNLNQNPNSYPNEYPSNLYQFQNAADYYCRDPKFAEMIGEQYTLTKDVRLPTGDTVPANTRIFIHNVFVTSTGEELVTIVAPFTKDGTISNHTFKDIPANQLL
ncbi:hypothetical protein SAMN05444673_3440 [Bacillus sp. OV166]|nr:hypothetical protein SAMN05444673_3440 [Bacillus sp. OV166]